MIEFEDHSEENQRAILEYLDREKQATGPERSHRHVGAVTLILWFAFVFFVEWHRTAWEWVRRFHENGSAWIWMGGSLVVIALLVILGFAVVENWKPCAKQEHSEENRRPPLGYMDREEQTSSRLRCPYCGASDLFPGVRMVMAYRCRECGKLVQVGHGS